MTAAALLAAPAGFALGGLLVSRFPQALRARPWWITWSVAIASALGALAAGGQPAGLPVLDPIARMVFGGGVVVLARRARLVAVAIGAVVIAAASSLSGDGLAAPAMLAAGVAVALALVERRARVVTPLVVAVAVQAGLRLGFAHPNGLSAAVVAAGLAPVAVSGYRRQRRVAKRRLRQAALVTTSAAVAAALGGVLAVALARPHLETGLRRGEAGLSAARAARQEAAASDLDAARASFGRAAADLGSWWARPARAVPLVNAHVRALDAAARSGERLSSAGVSVATAADLGGLRVDDGRLPLDAVEALARPVGSARRSVAGTRRTLRQARSPWLVPPVTARLDRVLERLDDTESTLRTTGDVLRVLPGLLGEGGPRNWFLAMQTPSEARASGGFIGNYGQIVADHGKVTLPRTGRIAELNAGGTRDRTLTGPPDYVGRYARFDVASTWQNVTMSPDFPSVAQVIGGLYPQSGGEPIDGVIAVDPAGLAALLKLTGPVAVPGWPDPLTADNAERVLLYDQYVKLANPDRIDFLGDATRVVWDRLTTGQLPAPRALLDALAPAVRGRHLMVSSLRPEEDAVLAEVGVNGRMAPVDGDSLAVVTQNATGSKIEWFLRRQVDYAAAVGPAGALTAKVSVRLHNDAPPAGLPPYLIGNSVGARPGTDRLYVSVYTPWDLAGARLDGQPLALESEIELGRHVYSVYVDVPPRGDAVLELDLSGVYSRAGPYRLDLLPQPLVNADRVVLDTPVRERSLALDRPRRLMAGPARAGGRSR